MINFDRALLSFFYWFFHCRDSFLAVRQGLWGVLIGQTRHHLLRLNIDVQVSLLAVRWAHFHHVQWAESVHIRKVEQLIHQLRLDRLEYLGLVHGGLGLARFELNSLSDWLGWSIFALYLVLNLYLVFFSSDIDVEFLQ